MTHAPRATWCRAAPAAAVAPLLLVAAVFTQAPARQAPPPAGTRQEPSATFRVQVNYVEVDVFVTDRQGQLVRGLRKEDFQILEDGKPQSVATFEVVDIPWEPADRGPAEVRPLMSLRPVDQPDVETNAAGFNGRVYLIALDDLHTRATRTSLARAVAKRFIERAVGQHDVAAVVTTSGNRRAAQEFTTNRRALAAAVDRFVGQKADSPTLVAIGQPLLPQNDNRKDPVDISEGNLSEKETKQAPGMDGEAGYRVANARATIDTLTRLSAYASTIRGRRKAVVLISEGFDYNLSDTKGTPREIRDRVRDLVAAANRSNVSIYAIDPRGVTQGGDEAVEVMGMDYRDLEYWLTTGHAMLQSELKISQETLQIFAEGTGGFAVVNTAKFLEAFDRVRDDNSAYYLLSYNSANDRREGRFRTIDVRVNRPGVTVRARRGYVEPKGRAAGPGAPAVHAAEGTSEALRDALNNPLPSVGVALAAAAAPFRGEHGRASVLVLTHVSGRSLAFVTGEEGDTASLEVSMVAVDEVGQGRDGRRLEVDLPLGPELRDIVGRAGVLLSTRLNLAPGRYQIRIGARDAGSGRVGTIRYELEIPDFAAAPLSMSGLVLSSRIAGQVPAPEPDRALQDILEGPPLTARAFSIEDELSLAAEIYDTQGATPHRVDIATSVRTEGGRVVYRFDEERSSEDLGGARGSYGYTLQLPLRELPPGRYVLSVEARSRLAKVATVTREIRFDVFQ